MRLLARGMCALLLVAAMSCSSGSSADKDTLADTGRADDSAGSPEGSLPDAAVDVPPGDTAAPDVGGDMMPEDAPLDLPLPDAGAEESGPETVDDVVKDVAPDPDEEVLSEVAEDGAGDVPTPTEYSAIDFLYSQSGGFMGMQEEYVLAGDQLGSKINGKDCTVQLTPQQLNTILVAAEVVDWEAVKPSYVNPENPYCCCDQFVYEVSGTLTKVAGGVTTVASTWCDESLFDNGVPKDLLDFIAVYILVAVEATENCP
jgi:hypothetical protein